MSDRKMGLNEGEKNLSEVLYDMKTSEHEFQEILRRHMEEGKQISLGELFYSPHVSADQFRAIMRHYQESGSIELALPYLHSLYMSRRRFMRLTAALGGALAMGSLAGCVQPKTAAPAPSPSVTESPSPKAIKKGKLGLGAISVLDCEGYGYIIKENKILEEMGYDVKYLYVPTSPTLVEGFIAGEIDGLYPGASTVAMAVEKGIPMKNVATSMITHGGWSVRKELYEKGITDMDKFFEHAKERKAQGKPITVVTQVPATTTYLWYGVTCLKYGMDPQKDFDVKMLPPAEVALSLISGRAEAQSMCEQWDTYPEYLGQSRVIGHGMSERPHCMFGHPDATNENSYAICTSFAYNPKLAPQAKRDYVEAQRKAVQFMRDQPLEAMKMMARISRTPLTVEYVGLFRRPRWQTGIWYYSMEQQYKGFQMLGLAKGGLKIEDWHDTEFATELKPPFPSLAGFIAKEGPNDVVSDAFVKQVYEDAKKFIGAAEF